jgi:beta-glucosidase-like glycosyl hydrolase
MYCAGSVLLKNDLVPGTSTPVLPLDKGALSKVCITGPLADSAEYLMGNYYGKWDGEAALTPKQAIKEELGECKGWGVG